MPEVLTADEVKALREMVGLGMMDCKRILLLARTEEFGGDVPLAFAYVDSNSNAVHVKGDRHAFMLSRARARVESIRERFPALDAAYPALPPAPSP